MAPCREVALDQGEVFRLDAKAEGDQVAIGGWLTKGGRRAREAPWFAVSLDRRSAPWAFHRGEPFRTIASLELLAALVGVMTLCPLSEWDTGRDSTGWVTIGCGTDNQGNSFLVDKLLTTKFPLGVILMEVAHQLHLRRAVLRANWVPRLQNEEADALTNGDYHHFTPELRVPVDLAKLEFGVLNDLLSEGLAYYDEVEAKKSEMRAKVASGVKTPKARKRAGEALRDRDPW